MLHEYSKIDTPTARHFGGGYFDLVVWYAGVQGSPEKASPVEANGIDYARRRIVGFQLGYGVEWSSGNTLTYLRGKYSHSNVDADKRGRSPILTSSGGFDRDRISQRFIMEAAEIDPAVREFVLEKLRAYREDEDVGDWIFPPS